MVAPNDLSILYNNVNSLSINGGVSFLTQGSILDQLSVQSAASYSVRLVRAEFSNPLFRVRSTAGGSPEQDIGFTSLGDLDVVALMNFVGANSGYISAWYDQSGNGLNLTQITAAAQPRIVNAGVLQTKNNRPFISFFGVVSGQHNSLALSTPMTTVGAANAVIYEDAAGDGFFLGGNSTFNWHSAPPNFLFSVANTSASIRNGQGFYNGTSMTPTAIPWPTSLSVVTMLPQTPGTGTAWDNIGKDRNVHHTNNGGGWSELNFYPSNLSTSNRQTLERNQGAYFGVSVS